MNRSKGKGKKGLEMPEREGKQAAEKERPRATRARYIFVPKIHYVAVNRG